MADKLAGVVGTRRSMKELVDGTLRVQIDIDRQFKRAFHAMFPDIDTAVVLAPFVETTATVAAATEAAAQATAKETKKHEHREPRLSEWVALRCKEEVFQGFLHDELPTIWGSVVELADRADDEWIAAEVVRQHCGIGSRADLDTNAEAAKRMHQLRVLYHQWASINAGIGS